MLIEHYMDLLDDSGQIGITSYRCLICGEVIDHVILQNRVRPAPNLSFGAKQRKYAQRIEEDVSTTVTSSGAAGDDQDDRERS